jgi:hypothetical protein
MLNKKQAPLESGTPRVIESDAPVVVQFTRLDSGRKEDAGMSAMAFSADES